MQFIMVFIIFTEHVVFHFESIPGRHSAKEWQEWFYEYLKLARDYPPWVAERALHGQYAYTL